MENFFLGLILFVLYFSVLRAVFLSSTSSDNINDKATTAKPSALQTVSTVTDIKTNSKDTIYPEDVFKLLDETPDTIDDFVQSLSLLKARKVAKTLSIKQTVTNNKIKKDKSLGWLKREIKQRLYSVQDTQKINTIIHQFQAS